MARPNKHQERVCMYSREWRLIGRISQKQADELVKGTQAITVGSSSSKAVRLVVDVNASSSCAITSSDIEAAAGCYGMAAQKKVTEQKLRPWLQERDRRAVLARSMGLR
jgi:uncharacterized protein (DUF697 family)